MTKTAGGLRLSETRVLDEIRALANEIANTDPDRNGKVRMLVWLVGTMRQLFTQQQLIRIPHSVALDVEGCASMKFYSKHAHQTVVMSCDLHSGAGDYVEVLYTVLKHAYSGPIAIESRSFLYPMGIPARQLVARELDACGVPVELFSRAVSAS
jgi:hypothetical protein